MRVYKAFPVEKMSSRMRLSTVPSSAVDHDIVPARENATCQVIWALCAECVAKCEPSLVLHNYTCPSCADAAYFSHGEKHANDEDPMAPISVSTMSMKREDIS